MTSDSGTYKHYSLLGYVSRKMNISGCFTAAENQLMYMNDNQHNRKYIYVEQFDWNGNPVKKYKLDDWGYFCVDEKNQTLYLASTAGVNALLKYDLSDN